jgi:hypothetical protein
VISLGQLAAVTAAIAFLVLIIGMVIGGIKLVLAVAPRPASASSRPSSKTDRYSYALSAILPAEETRAEYHRRMADVLMTRRRDGGTAEASEALWAQVRAADNKFVDGQRGALRDVFTLPQLEAVAALFESVPAFEQLWEKAQLQRDSAAEALYAELCQPGGAPAPLPAPRRLDRQRKFRPIRADGQNERYRLPDEPSAQAAG